MDFQKKRSFSIMDSTLYLFIFVPCVNMRCRTIKDEINFKCNYVQPISCDYSCKVLYTSQ